MRRFIALIIMLVVPLQFAWAVAASVHGHLDGNVAPLVMHAHSHDDHGHDHHAASDEGQSKEGHHHGDHCHPVFSSLIMESSLPLGLCLAGGPCAHPPENFLSRTPPLFDRPPLAHA